MKKIFSLCAVAVLSAFTAFSQCTTGGTLFGTIAAPCDPSGPASVNIAGFEVWRGDLYEATDLQAGASYSFDICQGTGGTAWNASLTVVDPNGTVVASGLDAGSLCEISFVATVAGTYQFFVNEVGECPGVSQSIDNGVPRINYFSGGSCAPLVTTCVAGTVGAAPATLCPADEFLYTVNTLTIPTLGDLSVRFDPISGGTGGTGAAFNLGITGLVPGTADDTLNVLLDNLADFADGVTFFPLEGLWTLTTEITSDGATVCASSASIVVDFLTLADASCTPVTTCEAGITNSLGTATSLCPGVSTTAIVNGTVVPNSPTTGEAGIDLTPVPGSGSGGLGGNFVLTGFTANDFATGIVLDDDLSGVLSTNGFPPLRGQWEIEPYVYADNADPFTKCDSAATFVIEFNGAGINGCPGTACQVGSIANGDQTVCPGDDTVLGLTGELISDLPELTVFYIFVDTAETDSVFFVPFLPTGPATYNFTGDLNATLAGAGLPVIPPGTYFGFAGVFDALADGGAGAFCGFSDPANDFLYTVLDGSDPVCNPIPDCSLPYPQVQNASATQNANGSITYAWDPIPGQIGCQVNVVVGDLSSPVAQTSIIIGGPGASSFTAGASALSDFPFQTINFRVRCGCQQNPTVIAGQFTDFSSVFNIVSSVAKSDAPTVENEIVRVKDQLIITKSASTKANKVNQHQLMTSSGLELVPSYVGPIDVDAPKPTITREFGTQSRVKDSFELYPNPTNGLVNVNYAANAEGVVNVRVFDMVGKAAADFTVSVNKGQNFLNFDLSSLDRGVYLVEILSGNTSSTAKVVLK